MHTYTGMYFLQAGDTPLVPCRYNHTATAVDVGRGVTEVVIFGGLEKCWRIDKTTILTFGMWREPVKSDDVYILHSPYRYRLSVSLVRELHSEQLLILPATAAAVSSPAGSDPHPSGEGETTAHHALQGETVTIETLSFSAPTTIQ